MSKIELFCTGRGIYPTYKGDSALHLDECAYMRMKSD